MRRSLILRLFFVSLTLMLISCQGKRPLDLGVNGDGRLNSCPDKPNCISSYDKTERKDQYIEPIQIHSNKTTAYKKLLSIITSEGAQIIIKEENYIYAEFTSSLFKFVDDVEFYFSSDTANILIRSASRIGKSDLGVNKKRIETIRFRFQQNDYQK